MKDLAVFMVGINGKVRLFNVTIIFLLNDVLDGINSFVNLLLQQVIVNNFEIVATIYIIV